MNPAPRILIVDDDDAIREFVGLFLTDEGFAVDSAAHGAAALTILDTVVPHLILLDLSMPVMDGWEFVRTYRDRPGPHAPVVALTAAHDPATAVEQLHPDGVLPKPFGLDDLLAVVKRFTNGG